MRNKKDQQAIAQIRDEQGNTVSDPITMAQLFNEYFVSAPGKVESGLPGGNGLDTSVLKIFYEKSGNRNDRVYQRTRGDILGLFMRPKPVIICNIDKDLCCFVTQVLMAREKKRPGFWPI
ncbi:hypothetical protein J6590_097204 [Homalodisca vitripennis]|nr:hypothetical protein J6590_097204 [Homalodisca vitripennis]